MPPRTIRRSYPIMLHRTPYGVGPYGADDYRSGIGPSAQFGKDGYIFVYQDVRGRLDVGGDLRHTCGRCTTKQGPTDIDESTDTYDTIDWLLKNVPGPQRQGGPVGDLLPRLLHRGGMIDAHPALKAVSPQAPITDLVRRRRLAPQRRLPARHTFGFMNFFRKLRPATNVPHPGTSRLRCRHARRLRLLPRHGPAHKRRLANISRAAMPFWNDMMKHRVLRRLLARPATSAATSRTSSPPS